MKMICYRCGHVMVWGGDNSFDDFEFENEGVMSNFSCNNCNAYCEFYMPEIQEVKSNNRGVIR